VVDLTALHPRRPPPSGPRTTVDFLDGVTAGLRRSTDVARAIIERTRAT
jgi:hypothetical protein